jgi:hypothetical protein
MRLVKRLVPSQDIDALLGDITEEERHRSRLWYWGQLIAVVRVAAWKDVRAHKWLVVRATITGVLTRVVFLAPAVLILQAVHVLSEGGYSVGPFGLTLPDTAPLVSLFILNATGFALSGWMVARSHREQGFAMVLPYLGLVCVIPPLVIVRMLTLVPGYMDGGGWPEVWPIFLSPLDIVSPVWVMSGAILGTRECRNARQAGERL